MMNIKFIAEKVGSYFPTEIESEVTISFEADTYASVEELNNLYTKFLIAIGYDVKQENKEVDNG